MKSSNGLSIESLSLHYQLVACLNPYPQNARTHTKHQIRKIADSIRSFGFTNPVLVDKENTIIAGHGRVEAAKLLNLEKVPTIRLEQLTPTQIRAYVIADNRMALDAGWDEQILKIELQNLVLDNELDISLTGFEIAEIDLIINAPAEDNSADQIPDECRAVICQPGDIWQLGEHRILCGDMRDPSSLQMLMRDRKAAMIFTDPPYNVVIDGNVSGKGAIKHGDFAMATGEMSSIEFTAFLEVTLGNLAAHSEAGSVHFICMDWRQETPAQS